MFWHVQKTRTYKLSQKKGHQIRLETTDTELFVSGCNQASHSTAVVLQHFEVGNPKPPIIMVHWKITPNERKPILEIDPAIHWTIIIGRFWVVSNLWSHWFVSESPHRSRNVVWAARWLACLSVWLIWSLLAMDLGREFFKKTDRKGGGYCTV